MYNEMPVFVIVEGHGNDGMDIRISKLRAKPEWQLARVEDPLFSYKAFPLGYMYYQQRAYYVSRIPARQFKAGLDRNHVVFEPLLMDRNGIFMSKDMENCILGNHPTLENALKLLDKDVYSVPFHRYFAVTRNNTLQYRGAEVGGLRLGGQTPFFELFESPQRSFIARILADLHIPGA
jgi:hypothetical protein